MELIGLIPAGGSAKRMGKLACSKEIFPVGFDEAGYPKAISQHLLEKYKAAACQKVYFVLREGKWDIPTYYGDGQDLGMDFGYLMLRHLHGVPYTVDQAYPFVKDAVVMLGFPDMLYEPADVFAQLVAYHQQSGADLVLGLYQVENEYEASKSDMVAWEESTGNIIDIQIKPPQTDRRYAWTNMVWGPAFTAFLHDFIAADLQKREEDTNMPEIHFSEILLAAIEAGLSLKVKTFGDQKFLDVGTLRSMKKAWKRML
ncbi:MAG: sugar phosphate nucleotidyltransferase [Bacteroidota bacterium]